jgi:hypothetical protein
LIPRIHLFELEDQPWFPSVIRDLATDYLHFMENLVSANRPMVPLLAEALRETGSTTVVDLCAGGGGPVVAIREELTRAGLNVRFILTDKFPNYNAFRSISANHAGIEGHNAPVDATAVPTQLAGFRTMFNAFHHFKPNDARAVLQSAVAARQPIAIFELPERTIPVIAATFLLVPIVVLLVTPFIRPFRWDRLLFTYLPPLVPLLCWWDGTVSQLRAYSVAELEDLAASLGDVGYQWRAGRIRSQGAAPHVTYLIGLPNRRAA